MRYVRANDSGAFAVDRHFDCRVIKRLGKFHVAQGRKRQQLLADFLGKTFVVSDVGPTHRNFDGGFHPKIYHLTQQIRGFKRKSDSRDLLGELLPKLVLELFSSVSSSGPVFGMENAFLGASVPEVEEVDRIG